MMISAFGWKRDHGRNLLFNTEVADLSVTETTPANFHKGVPILQVNFGTIPVPHVTGVTISAHASMRLGGEYLLQTQLSREEIARLFLLTHRRELDPFLGVLREANGATS